MRLAWEGRGIGGRLISLVGTVVLWGAATIGLTRNLGSPARFHGDETGWVIESTRAFDLFFIERDWTDPTWQESFIYCWRASPPVAKYLMGFSLWGHGYGALYRRYLQPVTFYRAVRWEKGGFRGETLPPALLRAARLPVALLGAGCGVLAFWLGRQVGGWIVGLGAFLLLGFHPLLRLQSQRAMVDVPALFFTMLAVWGEIRLLTELLKRTPGSRWLAWSFGVGLSVGLAVGCKLSALVVFGVLALLHVGGSVYLTEWADARGDEDNEAVARRLLGSLAVVGIVGVGVFVGLNPYLYHAPLVHFRQMASVSRVLEGYRPDFPQWALWTLPEKFGRVLQRSLHTYGTIYNLCGVPLDALLIPLGAVLLGRRLKGGRSVSGGQESAVPAVLLAWGLVTFAGLGRWIPLDWDRYYLPLAPAFAVWESYGVAQAGRAAWSRAKAWRQGEKEKHGYVFGERG